MTSLSVRVHLAWRVFAYRNMVVRSHMLGARVGFCEKTYGHAMDMRVLMRAVKRVSFSS